MSDFIDWRKHMSMALSRRKVLKMTLAPAFLSRWQVPLTLDMQAAELQFPLCR